MERKLAAYSGYIRTAAMEPVSERSGGLMDAPHPYRKGLHVVVDATGLDASPLRDMEGFRIRIGERIEALGLVSVGAVHHAFPGGGFTAVVCLTESHLSIHTWPEHGRATFDVFLSNFSRENNAAVEDLVATITAFLGRGRYERTTLHR